MLKGDNKNKWNFYFMSGIVLKNKILLFFSLLFTFDLRNKNADIKFSAHDEFQE